MSFGIRCLFLCMLPMVMNADYICFAARLSNVCYPPFALTRFAQTRRLRADIFSRLADAKLQKICLS